MTYGRKTKIKMTEKNILKVPLELNTMQTDHGCEELEDQCTLNNFCNNNFYETDDL